MSAPPGDNNGGAGGDPLLNLIRNAATLGRTLGEQLIGRMEDRGNVPRPIEEDIAMPSNPDEARDYTPPPGKLWIVDRILEPQTLPHFFEAVSYETLPGGLPCDIPGPTEEEVMLVACPWRDWATGRFASLDHEPMYHLSGRIASYEHTTNLLLISKDLHAPKSRVWEGVMPLSIRQWVDKGLDKPENFSEACQHIASVTRVFQYLGHPGVAAGLRETYNAVYDELGAFEDALNARRRQAGGQEPAVQLRAWWAAFMRAHFDLMTRRAHAWVLDRVGRLRAPVLEEMRGLVGGSGDAQGARMLELGNRIQDVSENMAQADLDIYVSTQGYRGMPSAAAAAATEVDPSPREPLAGAHPDPRKRAERYHLRLRYLSRVEQQGGVEPRPESFLGLGGGSNGPGDDPVGFVEAQVRAQARARAELRCEPPVPPAVRGAAEGWILDLRRQLPHPQNVQWAYVGYRAVAAPAPARSEAEWAEFERRFEADAGDWGAELGDVDDIREISKVTWLDARELGIDGGDLEAVKRHFASYVAGADHPAHIYRDAFLVADQPSVDSYLDPIPGSPRGGSVLAVDAAFDPDSQERADESPGYGGALRVRSSLLWDDVGALVALQTQHYADLWPLAAAHPLQVYEGPVVPAGRRRWEALARAREGAGGRGSSGGGGFEEA